MQLVFPENSGTEMTGVARRGAGALHLPCRITNVQRYDFVTSVNRKAVYGRLCHSSAL